MMTKEISYVNTEPTNPVLAIALTKGITDMSEATNKITTLDCRLSQADEHAGESLSIENQENICQGCFLRSATLFFSGNFATPSEGQTSRRRDTLTARMGRVCPSSFVPLGERTTAVRQYHRRPFGRW